MADAGADGFAFAAPVGSHAPNEWGLCDLFGNVQEWTRDAHVPLAGHPLRDGDGLRSDAVAASQFGRCHRGGGLDQPSPAAPWSFRNADAPDQPYWARGFRVARPAR